MRDISRYYEAWDRCGILYGGLVELIRDFRDEGGNGAEVAARAERMLRHGNVSVRLMLALTDVN